MNVKIKNDIWVYLCLVFGGLVFAYPFLWMLSATFKPEMEIAGIGLWSSNFNLENYRAVFAKIPIGRALLNSIFVSSCVTFSAVLFGSVVGYALARLKFIGRDLIFRRDPADDGDPFPDYPNSDVYPDGEIRLGGHLSVADCARHDQYLRDSSFSSILPGYSPGFDRRRPH